MTRAIVRAGLLLAVLAGVSACGNKGPLVLPEQDKAKPAEPAKAEATKGAAEPDAPRR